MPRSSNRITLSVLLIALFCPHAFPNAVVGSESHEEVATRLHIVAKIAGSDELHISHRKAVWKHRSQRWPAEVIINGQTWAPEKQPVWNCEQKGHFLRSNIDLRGAVLNNLGGRRGQVSLSHGHNELIIRFRDPKAGVGTFEVVVDFADVLLNHWPQALQGKRTEVAPASSPDMVTLTIRARISGTSTLFLRPDRARFVINKGALPTNATVNGRSWNPEKHAAISLASDYLLPRGVDLSRATLKKLSGRGTVRLVKYADLKYPDRLNVWFHDPSPGEDEYSVDVTIPVREYCRVVVRCDAPEHTAGATLSILNHAADGPSPKLLNGQYALDDQGQAVVALPAGVYEFEVSHQPKPDILVALKSGPIKIDGPQHVVFKSRSVSGLVLQTLHRKLPLTNFGVRSIRPTGEVKWVRAPKSPTTAPVVILSPDHDYRIRAIGSNANVHVAFWGDVSGSRMNRILVEDSRWIRCKFRWHPQALPHAQAAAVLTFPDTKMTVPIVPETLLLTNRRFLEVSFWQQWSGQRKAVFHPRGCLLPAPPSQYEFVFGGQLTPHAGAAILTAEKRGDPRAKRLWAHICLRTPQGRVLNPKASKIGWKSSVVMRDGSPLPKYPLTQEARHRLGDLSDTILLTASCQLDKPIKYAIAPVTFTPAKSPHFRTQVPAYMQWRVAAYLSKAERSLAGIAAVREKPIPQNYTVNLRWWLNYGAVGGRRAITMPLRNMIGDFSWFTHPWAISHELLHGFGFGHTWQMARADGLVQDRFGYFRWYVADHPEFVPKVWPPAADNMPTAPTAK